MNSVAPFLRAVFLNEENSPFAAQAASMQVNSLGQDRLDAGTDGGAKQNLSKVEDLLHQVLAGNVDQSLGKLVSKFLVDIAPFMK